MLNGAAVYDSFTQAANAVEHLENEQTPCFDANGDGNCDDGSTVVQFAREYAIGMGVLLAPDNPAIGAVSPEQVLYGETSASIWAENVNATGTMESVRAVIIPPEKSDSDPTSDPATMCDLNLPALTLNHAGNGRYVGEYDGFTEIGTYKIVLYAMDTDGNMSELASTKVRQSALDRHEPDDTPDQADVIFINDDAQKHNFHERGDADWIRFYGRSDTSYEIKAGSLGADCDIVIELHGDDLTTPLKTRNLRGPGEDELLSWRAPQSGVYHMRLTNAAGASGADTEYELEMDIPIAPEHGWLRGTIRDAASGESLPNAVVAIQLGTDKSVALSGRDGEYLIPHESGKFTVTAEAPGYKRETRSEVSIHEDDSTLLEFQLRSIGHLVTPDLWIRAVIHTEEKGPIDAVWREGGRENTSRGDTVLWGHFHASPDDVTWGSGNNPDLFVKIWFDVGGRVDVNFFHVSVPDIEVLSDHPFDGVPDEHGVTTLSRRYIRHYFQEGGSHADEQDEDGNPPADIRPTGNPL